MRLSLRFAYRRPVGEDNDARTQRLRICEPQNFRIAFVLEEPFSAAYDDGKDHEPILVDQVVLHQRVHEIAAAEDQDVLAGLLLELGHFFGDVSLDQR
jgi:hypothetical protein